MSTDPTWSRIPEELGRALWEVYRQWLGKGANVGGTRTDETYVLTEVYVGDTPMLRCETRRDSADAPRETWRHTFAVPVWPDVEAAWDEGYAKGREVRDVG